MEEGKKLVLFEYCVLFHPTKEEMKKGQSTELIVSPNTILAVSEKAAVFSVIREVPEKCADKSEQVEILIHPF